MSDPAVRKDVLRIVAVLVMLSLLSVATVLMLTEQQVSKTRQDILDQKTIAASALAGRFNLRIDDATNVLKIATRSERFSEAISPQLVSTQYNGIPDGLEQDKRQATRDILEEYGIFETIAFVLPSGDIYFVEPYEAQLALPRLNFADREWYQNVIETGKPYASDVIISGASNHRVIPIAVPIFSDDGKLSGIIAAGVNLALVESQLRNELNLSNNNRLILVDGKGNAIEDISETSSDTYSQIETMAHLESVQAVLAGDSGHTIEMVDGFETLTVYRPISIANQHWGVLLMQPIDEAFGASDYLRQQSYTLLGIIVIIIGAAGYFLVSFRTNSLIARQLSKTNSELVITNRLKDEFLRIASHELRTPIQPILAFCELATSGVVSHDEAWKAVFREARKLNRLASNIMEAALIRGGSMQLDQHNTRIATIINEAVEQNRASIDKKKLALQLNIGEKCEDMELYGDESRLTGVVSELIHNAVNFTQSGTISIYCKTDSATQELILQVKDTGTAIPDDILPRIFDIFASRSATDPSIQGAGLGLFICKAVIEAHGGTIMARNNSDGPGAIFEIRLPLHMNMKNRAVAA